MWPHHLPKENSPSLTDSPDIDLAIIILADGVRPDVVSKLAAAGEIPNIAECFFHEGYSYEGVTVLPSVSSVAYVPMLTGQYPGTADVPGLRWVEKSSFTLGRLFLQGHRSYIAPGHLKMDEDLSDDLETLFELTPDSLGVRCDIRRGLSNGSKATGQLAFMPQMFLAHYLRRGDFVDRVVMAQALSWLHKTHDRRPRFIFLPLVDVDKVSHRFGPEHVRTLKAYRGIDSLVGKLVDALKKQRLWKRTHLMITSDHGHTDTKQHLDMSAMVSELGYSVFEYPNVYRRSADAAVMVSGNSFGNIYLSSDGKWEAPLTSEELEKEHGNVLRALSQREEVEWFAYRDGDAGVKIVSGCSEAVLHTDDGHYNYAFNGADPLQLGLRHSRIMRSDSLKKTAESPFPDAFEQLTHLFQSDRTGDVIVTARSGYDLRGWREFPEHRSSHGALCKEHMAVPILSNIPLSAISDGLARTVDLFPTVVEGLGLSPTRPHFGRSLL